MSSDLERRLEAMFAEAPDPEPGAGEEALHRALRAVHPITVSRRGLRTAVLAFATAVVLLVIAAGSLAAAGALHVSLGSKPKRTHPAALLTLPQGANGVAAIVNGRLSVATRGGGRLQVRATAAALSPRVLYVAAGIGNSLVAMAPDGRRAWSHPTGGKVVAIAWAPDGFRIAYVVQAGHRFALHVIYGNGVHDTTIDSSVRPVRPSWRADSLALAYVGGGGKAIVYDLAHVSRSVVARSAGMGAVTQLAFAPSGGGLAIAGRSGIATKRVCRLPAFPKRSVGWIGWLGSSLLVAHGGRRTALDSLSCGGGFGSSDFGGTIVAFDARGPRVAVAVARGTNVVLLVGDSLPLHNLRQVARLPRGAHVTDLLVG
ncbi:MAG TPA: hypothetical protein VGK69_05820 [Gaiellaceae bacterium]